MRQEMVMETKHTLGPIVIRESTGGYTLCADSVGPAKPEGGHYQVIGSATQREPHPKHGGGVTWETAQANAALWAAAPAMFAALAGAQRKLCEDSCPTKWKAGEPMPHCAECDSARAALAEARGERP
jgi:hypothetical protein